ncbi:MAG TPA: hypothetical protein VMU73_03145 [Gaiellaceae bacterium]|nr:hypothetical protein [Gaiellaceae bacterium]
MDLSHVLWIGGGQGSGKSSIARALARRFDLQLYNVDHRTWEHERRMPDTEFRLLSMDERWVNATTERMLDWFVVTSRHRFRLVLEDVRGLPPTPMAIVEGPQLLPTSVSSVLAVPDQALFLIPDAGEQERRLLARGPLPGTSDGVRARANATERDLLISSRIAREARELRLAALPVDRPLDGMVEVVADHFRAAIERGPRLADLAAVRRIENDALARQVRLYGESLAPQRLPDEPFAFACECGGSGCAEIVELSLVAYEKISASGDRSPLRRPTP